ncbi:elongation factor P maturation arginine rhamnosyltransferase EarP, partial [Ramlibacter aquaticus]
VPCFDTLRRHLEADACSMVLRAFHLAASRLDPGMGRSSSDVAPGFWTSRRLVPLVGLAYRRNLALRLSASTQGRAVARHQPEAPLWIQRALECACARQLAALRTLLEDAGQPRGAESLQVDTIATSLWEASLGQWRDLASTNRFVRLIMPGFRDLLAVACHRYRKALEDEQPDCAAPGPESSPPAEAAGLHAQGVVALPRSPVGRPRSVDLFCSRQSREALWFAHNLADHYARTCELQVNLYLTKGSIFADVFRLFQGPEDLPPRLALREFQSFGGHPAGDLAIAMFGSDLPPGYLVHRRRCGTRAWIYRLAPLGVDLQALAPQDPLGYEVLLPQGFAPLGHVKPPVNLHAMRRHIHGHPALLGRFLAGAGGLRAPAPQEVTVYASLQDAGELRPWLQAWRRSPRPVRVLVPSLRFRNVLAEDPDLLESVGPETTAGSLTVAALALHSVPHGDPILAACDFALTDDESLMVRAQAAGVPQLSPLRPAAQSLFGLGATHAMALACSRKTVDSRLILLDEILADWVSRQDMRPAWNDLLAALPVLQQLGAELAQDFAAAAHVGDCALAMA